MCFGNLREEEHIEFRPYIESNLPILRKRIGVEISQIIQRYYATALQIPKFAEIGGIDRKKEKIGVWNNLIGSVELPGFGILGSDVRSA